MEIIGKKNYLNRVLLIFFSLGYGASTNIIAYSGETGLNHISVNDFERSLYQNSVKFYEYENAKNLFDDFFGLNNPLNESSLKTNFQDLSLQIDSKNIRNLYKKKLLEMTGFNKSEEIKNGKDDWSFYNQKI